MQKCSGINSFGFIPQSTDQGAVKSRGVCCLKPIEITYHDVLIWGGISLFAQILKFLFWGGISLFAQILKFLLGT